MRWKELNQVASVLPNLPAVARPKVVEYLNSMRALRINIRRMPATQKI